MIDVEEHNLYQISTENTMLLWFELVAFDVN